MDSYFGCACQLTSGAYVLISHLYSRPSGPVKTRCLEFVPNQKITFVHVLRDQSTHRPYAPHLSFRKCFLISNSSPPKRRTDGEKVLCSMSALCVKYLSMLTSPATANPYSPSQPAIRRLVFDILVDFEVVLASTLNRTCPSFVVYIALRGEAVESVSFIVERLG